MALIVVRHPDPKRWTSNVGKEWSRDDLTLDEQGLAEGRCPGCRGP